MIYPFFEFIETILELSVFALQFVHRHCDGVELGESGSDSTRDTTTTTTRAHYFLVHEFRGTTVLKALLI